ncbi:MAG: hypothetical protein WCT20_03905 [Candidatus Babeliales bacterium]
MKKLFPLLLFIFASVGVRPAEARDLEKATATIKKGITTGARSPLVLTGAAAISLAILYGRFKFEQYNAPINNTCETQDQIPSVKDGADLTTNLNNQTQIQKILHWFKNQAFVQWLTQHRYLTYSVAAGCFVFLAGGNYFLVTLPEERERIAQEKKEQKDVDSLGESKNSSNTKTDDSPITTFSDADTTEADRLLKEEADEKADQEQKDAAEKTRLEEIAHKTQQEELQKLQQAFLDDNHKKRSNLPGAKEADEQAQRNADRKAAELEKKRAAEIIEQERKDAEALVAEQKRQQEVEYQASLAAQAVENAKTAAALAKKKQRQKNAMEIVKNDALQAVGPMVAANLVAKATRAQTTVANQQEAQINHEASLAMKEVKKKETGEKRLADEATRIAAESNARVYGKFSSSRPETPAQINPFDQIGDSLPDTTEEWDGQAQAIKRRLAPNGLSEYDVHLLELSSKFRWLMDARELTSANALMIEINNMYDKAPNREAASKILQPLVETHVKTEDALNELLIKKLSNHLIKNDII